MEHLTGSFEVHRIAFEPAPDIFYQKYGIGRSLNSRTIVSAIDLAWANVSRVFSAGGVLSRFSNGTWPVLYSAADPETACSEKGYWIFSSIYSKTTKPEKIKCIHYSFNIEVKYIDFLSKSNFEREIVHPNDYSFCWNIGDNAVKSEIDFIHVPSARKLNGCNFPIFNKNSITSILRSGKSLFYLQNGELYYIFLGNKNVVAIDKVYSLL